jgi:hypothetical protein
VTDKEVTAYVEGMLTERPAKPFQASVEEAEILRAVIALRAGHASGVSADPWFVENLHRELAAIGTDHSRPIGRSDHPPVKLEYFGRPDATRSGRPRTGRPWWAPIGKAAAAAVVVAASVTAAFTLGQRSPAPVAQPPPNAASVWSAALLASDGRPLGRAYAYNGNPAWVFMDVRDSGLTGSYVCELHLTNGTTAPAGLVTVYNGTGDWAHTVRVEAGQVRQATLVTPSGVAVASATFS